MYKAHARIIIDNNARAVVAYVTRYAFTHRIAVSENIAHAKRNIAQRYNIAPCNIAIECNA